MRPIAWLLVLLVAMSLTPGAVSETYEGRLLVGGFGAALEDRYVGYTGLTGERHDFTTSVGGRAFTLTATDMTGLGDVDICFHDVNGHELACFTEIGDESGVAPTRAVSGFVYAFVGVDISYELTFL